jgi:hypothetical protein
VDAAVEAPLDDIGDVIRGRLWTYLDGKKATIITKVNQVFAVYPGWV